MGPERGRDVHIADRYVFVCISHCTVPDIQANDIGVFPVKCKEQKKDSPSWFSNKMIFNLSRRRWGGSQKLQVWRQSVGNAGCPPERRTSPANGGQRGMMTDIVFKLHTNGDGTPWNILFSARKELLVSLSKRERPCCPYGVNTPPRYK